MKKNVLRILATYKGTGGRCTEEENIITPRFDVIPGQIAKAIRGQVYWLGKPIRIKIKLESDNEVIGKANGYLRAIDVREDQRSVWHFQFFARNEEAVAWISKVFQRNVILVIKRIK